MNSLTPEGATFSLVEEPPLDGTDGGCDCVLGRSKAAALPLSEEAETEVLFSWRVSNGAALPAERSNAVARRVRYCIVAACSECAVTVRKVKER